MFLFVGDLVIPRKDFLVTCLADDDKVIPVTVTITPGEGVQETNVGNNQATADLQRPSADDPMCLGSGMFVYVFVSRCLLVQLIILMSLLNHAFTNVSLPGRLPSTLTGFSLGLVNLEKMGRYFPVREKSGNFEQTGKVRENHTIYMSHFSYSCKMWYLLNLVLENWEYLWFY